MSVVKIQMIKKLLLIMYRTYKTSLGKTLCSVEILSEVVAVAKYAEQFVPYLKCQL